MDSILNAIPEKYRTTVIALIAIAPYVTRGIHALINGRGLKGVLAGIWLGTNTPAADAPNRLT